MSANITQRADLATDMWDDYSSDMDAQGSVHINDEDGCLAMAEDGSNAMAEPHLAAPCLPLQFMVPPPIPAAPGHINVNADIAANAWGSNDSESESHLKAPIFYPLSQCTVNAEAWDNESDADADVSEPGPTADDAESTWGSNADNSPNPSL